MINVESSTKKYRFIIVMVMFAIASSVKLLKDIYIEEDQSITQFRSESIDRLQTPSSVPLSEDRASRAFVASRSRLIETISCGYLYEVKQGDWLSKIAYRAYGRPEGYKKIVEFNRDKISNSNLLIAGRKLYIPCLKSAEFAQISAPNQPELFDFNDTNLY